MSATTSLSDSLPSSIPKLNSTGVNWAIFLVCFQDAVEVKGFWGHFDISSSHPVAVAVSVTTTDGTTTMTPPTDAETATMDQLDKDEWSAKSLLTQKIPDLTLMWFHTKRTVKESVMSILELVSQLLSNYGSYPRD